MSESIGPPPCIVLQFAPQYPGDPQPWLWSVVHVGETLYTGWEVGPATAGVVSAAFLQKVLRLKRAGT